MRKGIIMEVDERFLTMLTPEGEFLKAPNQKQDYEIGQEIAFIPLKDVQKNKSMFLSFFPGKALIAAVMALFIATAMFLPSFSEDEVYAYMSIDVNPSIELAVNDKLEVVKIQAFNHEGEQIVSKLNKWKKQDVSIVTTNIIKEIKKQGFFKNNKSVLISTVYDDKKGISEDLSKELLANIEEIEGKIVQDNLQVTVIEATKEEREAAHKQGITAGVYKEKHPLIEKLDVNLNKQQEGKSSSENTNENQQDEFIPITNELKKNKENISVKKTEDIKNNKDKGNNQVKEQKAEKKEKNKQPKDKEAILDKTKDKGKNKEKDKEKDNNNNSKNEEIISNNTIVLPNHKLEEKGKSKPLKEKEENPKPRHKDRKTHVIDEEIKEAKHKDRLTEKRNKEEKSRKQDKEKNNKNKKDNEEN